MSTLIPEQRRRVLEEILHSEGVVITRDVAVKLGVSAITVRRDLAELERAGVASAVSGGARLASGRRPPEARGERAILETEEKWAIAAAAADLIEDGMAIYLDAGTTCEAIARNLRGRSRLTVVTSDFSTAVALMGDPGVRTIHTGGEIDPASGSSAGLFAASTARRINTDLCFLSTGAWDLRRGVSTTSADKVAVKIAAVESAARCVLVAGSSKYGVSERYHVAPLAMLEQVITDDRLGTAARSELEAAKLEITFARPAGAKGHGVRARADSGVDEAGSE
ncbi:DeoR/GlpR family DNA-binding transcription regulator [Agromyces silvae]|uniref:DeoR/GlpR family DNA-binding transcription regulator n=1 Tax=Agromyces silvae TaxID=3388266 RepID=UPI00280AE50C|nr:DeoR/GlpR family DNA-binding transcription regulator [Agromyces protaetiae]